jgi:hypothetical protein
MDEEAFGRCRFLLLRWSRKLYSELRNSKANELWFESVQQLDGVWRPYFGVAVELRLLSALFGQGEGVGGYGA